MRPSHAFAVALVVAGLAFRAPPAMAADPPQARALVQETTDKVLQRLEKDSNLKGEPARVEGLIEDLVLPHFDFRRMTQWVLGRYWRQASAAQQERMVDEFRTLLVRTYGTALLEYTGQSIRYLPLHAREDADDVTVRTEIEQGSGPPITIDYRMHHDEGSGWKVYDIVVDGISLVTNYRSSFATTVRRSGIDGLIAELEERNARAAKGS